MFLIRRDGDFYATVAKTQVGSNAECHVSLILYLHEMHIFHLTSWKSQRCTHFIVYTVMYHGNHLVMILAYVST